MHVFSCRLSCFPGCLISKSIIPLGAREMADDTTFCRPCQRDFRTEKSLLQHRQNSGQHVYDCLRCDKHFASASAKEQHRNNSRNHYICYPCDFDSSSQDGLDQHDIDVHNTCGTCGLGFAFPSSLKTVSILT